MTNHIDVHSLLTTETLILVSMPFISGAIGWFTNFIAVKMLLKPIHPVNFLGYKIQGLLPRRHHELADRIAAAIARDFLTEESLADFIRQADAAGIMKDYIKKKWDEKIQDILGMVPMIQMFVPQDRLTQIRDTVAEHLQGNSDEFVKLLADSLSGKAGIEDTIRENILAFDLAHLSRLIEDIAKKEFRYIERLGGMIGFLIGAAQAGLVALFF